MIRFKHTLSVILACLSASLFPQVLAQDAPARQKPGVTIPLIDLNDHKDRQVVVDREKGQYLGHPTTVLLEDNKTMLCVYPKGHGRGAIVYKRSDDAGLTWSKRLPTPKSWATSKEVPTLHRVIGPDGKKRIIMFSGLYPVRMAVTEDDGKTWSELKPVGEWGGIVTMGCVEALRTGRGHYMAMFHDDGRFFASKPKVERPKVFTLYKTLSRDGGLTWSRPEAIHKSSDYHICEPGIIRSPDGKQLAVLLRENSRRHNSQIVFSDDEGRTWTKPRDLPGSLNGDRHTGKYAPDGRLFISFRSRSPGGYKGPTEGDWVAWVGTYEDLVRGREGQFHVRLKDNHRGADCAYPGVEVLPDGTFVTTTYGHWDKGESPYILCVRVKLSEIDAIAKRQAKKASRAIKIVAFGDSTTALRKTVKQVYADRLPALLKKQGIDATVINSGVGGSHTGRLKDNARQKRRHALDRFQDAVRDHEPDVVVIQFGWNDSWVDTAGEDDPSRIPLKEYVANLTFMVKTLKADGARVILMTPNRPQTSMAKWRVDRTASYAKAVRELAARLDVPLVHIWQAYDKYHAVDGQSLNDLLLDDVHPNDTGHRIVAELLTKEIAAARKQRAQPAGAP